MNDPARGEGRPRGAETVVDEYFARLARATAASRTEISAEELTELRTHIQDRLSATRGTAADAARVLDELGTPESLARAFADAAEDPASAGRSSTGRLLSVPYDVRPPTADRVALRVWNPTDPRVLVPKAFGMGWTINFGALAVKAHLVRPDDEDDAFAAVPEGVVTATLAAPIAVLVAFGVLAATAWSGLPATVPVHWNGAGHVDGYSSRGAAVLGLALLAVVPVLAAVWVHARRRAPFNRVVASAVSLAFAVMSVAFLAQTVVSARGGTGMWATWIGIGGFLILPFLLLVATSRLGSAAERRRDLPTTSTKGRAQ
ncbi:hypothetical protein GALL_364440 [mine drainage metagenome]|uniref:DUF1648 domain-containing protein n=1 Tax=mine drainage metagenome TaxID=410659 RepID=A0A1J5QPF6_9ZZZZ